MSGNADAINPRTTGFFGKIPGHGDFIDRGLTAGFKETWDNWLQHGLASSKAVIGESWLDTYLTSPVWRFVLCAGVCGPDPWAGIIIPSVDRVGRYFPLTIATSLPSDILPIQLIVTGAQWYDGAESLALQALEQDTTDANTLAEALEELGGMDIGPGNLRIAETVNAGQPANPLTLPLAYGSSLGQGLLAYTHGLTETRFGGTYSAWWTHGSGLVHPALMVCAQLPAPESFAGLLADQYMPTDWERLPAYLVGDEQPEIEDTAQTDQSDSTLTETPLSPETEAPQQGPTTEDETEQAAEFAPVQVSSDSILKDLGDSQAVENPE